MKATCLNIGNEVLCGKVTNTNAAFLAQELELLGIEVIKTIVVGDDDAAIGQVVEEFLGSNSEVLITSGGLGPTHDDLTKEAICKALGLELVYNESANQDMTLYFGSPKNDCNAKQAYFPTASQILHNYIGSADGAIIPFRNKHIILLVGPSLELQAMYHQGVKPYLEQFAHPMLYTDYILMGESESFIENLLVPLMQTFADVSIAPYAQLGAIRYRIKAIDKERYNQAKQAFEVLLAPYITSNLGESIEVTLYRLLLSRGETVSCAESMTGGMIASKITSVPGASQILKESYITYHPDAKTSILGVSPDTIHQFSAVSREVALAMVDGLHQKTKSELAIATTGYAGPEGVEVGRVWGAIYYCNHIATYTFKAHGNREMIRQKASNRMLYYAYRMMEGHYENNH